MAINSELDTLLIAVRRTLDLRDEAEERIRLCRQEIAEREQLLEEMSISIPELENRLKEVACRAGYLSQDDLSGEFDLASLEALVAEQIAASEDSSLPDNVVDFVPRLARVSSDQFESEDEPEDVSLEEAVQAIFRSLTKREEKVLRTIFGIGTEDGKNLTGRQVFYQRYAAKVLGLSPSTISRVSRRAMRKLRHPSRSDELRSYLDQVQGKPVETREQNLLGAIFGY